MTFVPRAVFRFFLTVQPAKKVENTRLGLAFSSNHQSNIVPPFGGFEENKLILTLGNLDVREPKRETEL